MEIPGGRSVGRTSSPPLVLSATDGGAPAAPTLSTRRVPVHPHRRRKRVVEVVLMGGLDRDARPHPLAVVDVSLAVASVKLRIGIDPGGTAVAHGGSFDYWVDNIRITGDDPGLEPRAATNECWSVIEP